MKNLFIVLFIVFAMGYMFSILFDKYKDIKNNSNKTEKIDKK